MAAKKQPPKVSQEEVAARRIATQAGYEIAEVFKVSAPDCDGEREMLFRGRWKGDSRAHIPAETQDELYRCVVRNEGTGFVVMGW